MIKHGHQPPRLVRQFLRWYAGDAAVEDLLGDLDELFYLNLDKMSPLQAKFKYTRQAFSLVGSYVLKRRRQRVSPHPYSNTSINLSMISNYLLMAWRVMTRNRVFTLINVLGLTLGISACIVVFLVVNYEFSFDRFHADRDRIFRLKTNDEGHPGWICVCVPGPVYPTLRDEYAGVEALAATHNFDAKVSVTENGQLKRFDRNTGSIVFTNAEYFKIFQYEWLAGDLNLMSDPMRVVLTESRAKTYFGNVEPQALIGKHITYNDSLQLTIGGVVKDWTERSDFVHSEFVSFSTIENSFVRNIIKLDNWGGMNHSSQGYVKINPGDTPGEVAATMKSVVRKKTKEQYAFSLEPLSGIHFHNESESEGAGGSKLLLTLSVLTGLAVFILVIAAINFINLSTAQSITRAREIGIRKVMGSRKQEIIIQFMCETFILSLISLFLSLALVRPLLSAFGSYLPPGITYDPLDPANWLFVAVLLFVISILAGIYPALVMSSQLPVSNLAARQMSHGRSLFPLRKVLVVFQFAVSLFFISATLVISGQMEYIKTKDRGLSTHGVMTFRTNWAAPISKVQTLTDRIRTFAGAEQVTMQGFSPIGFAMWINEFEYTGDNGTIKGNTSIKAGDEQYIPLYKLRLIAGRNFKPADSVNEVVVNEMFIKSIGIVDPHKAIGEQILFNGKQIAICGVVQDFHERSFRDAIGSCMIGNFKEQEHSVSVRFENEDLVANFSAIGRIESEFKAIYPDEAFYYHFIEEEIGWMHGEEKKTAELAKVAMAVTIFISCMGVFGLAMFTATRRTREIGIRKVLGASMWKIMTMLNREFVVLIILAIFIASPIAWYFSNNWLTTFTYRIPLTWWYFFAAGAIALLTALVTVSFQSIKAANSDPVKALKTD